MTLQPLLPGCMYHIYNHAVGNDNLFLRPDNYYYFLRRYDAFISPIADTYCYCLMPNHLHFFTEIKTRITIPQGTMYSDEQYISKQFSNVFNSYAQAFNKQNHRKGVLFRSRFHRDLVDSDQYITNVIKYIHLNPQRHGFVSDFRTWKYSSYNVICSQERTFLARQKVIDWFGNLLEFQRAHLDNDAFNLPDSFIIN